ncbi:MAG: glycosyltransferase family 4 protein [Flavobacteriales bacterium]|nr:glycosyltransferase family 4 protein [Flavobacteriales bacterium]
MRKRVGIVLYNDITIDSRVLNEIHILSTRYDLKILSAGTNPTNPKVAQHLDIEYVPIQSMYSRFKFISITSNSLFEDFWSKRIETFIIDHGLDAIHAHDLYMLLPSLNAAEKKGVPVIIDLHENYPAAFKSYTWTSRFPNRFFVNYDYWTQIEKSCLKRADGVVLLSENFENDLKQRYSTLTTSNFAVYPNVPDLDFFDYNTEILSKTDDVFRIFYFGMIGYSRGLHVASEGVRKLIDKGYKIELHIAGRVHKTDQKYFHQSVLKNFVNYLPWLDMKDLGRYLSKMDVGISPIFKNPQHESGIANKVFQYMLFSKPILVSNCIPQEELVNEENCGLVHEDQNPNEFAEKIEWLIKNPERRLKMGIRGREAVLKKYNTTVMGKRILTLYNQIF